jgi:DNA-binding transcriptional ArsR family regulator
MDAERSEARTATIAAAIGEPARARMLLCLQDGRARTSTELAVVGGVTPSTASVHLQRLRAQGLVRVNAQGKHRYYQLAGPRVGAALEALCVLAGGERDEFAPRTPHRLRFARTCYDHIAGTLGVRLNDRLLGLGWLRGARAGDAAYTVTPAGTAGLAALGVEVAAAQALRRRFAFACLDWSERRPHLGGALGAALLAAALKHRWVARELDDRCLRLTAPGRRVLRERLQLELPEPPEA